MIPNHAKRLICIEKKQVLTNFFPLFPFDPPEKSEKLLIFPGK